jgi:hypothetical protein
LAPASRSNAIFSNSISVEFSFLVGTLGGKK